MKECLDCQVVIRESHWNRHLKSKKHLSHSPQSSNQPSNPEPEPNLESIIQPNPEPIQSSNLEPSLDLQIPTDLDGEEQLQLLMALQMSLQEAGLSTGDNFCYDPFKELPEDELPLSQSSNLHSTTNPNCVICFSKPAQYALVPCGHQCLCEADAKSLIRRKMDCPICRKKIKSSLRIWN